MSTPSPGRSCPPLLLVSLSWYATPSPPKSNSSTSILPGMAAGVPPYGPGADVAVGVGVDVAVGVGTPTCVKCIQLMLPMPPVEPFASITSLTTCAPDGSVAAPPEEEIVCQFGTP